MAKIRYSVDCDLPPAVVIAALTDFTPRRAELWPDLDADAFKVIELGEDHAVVREGSNVGGGIWVVESYDWKTPGVIRAISGESNAVQAGGLWQTTVSDRPGGGSHIEVRMDRKPLGLKGRALHSMLQVVGPIILGRSLKKMLSRIT